MRTLVISLISLSAALAATNAGAQVFYPQAPAALPSPAYAAEDNLDLTLEIEGFTTNWGEGYSGVSYGAEADIDLSPSITLELEGKRLDTTIGSAFEYGAGLNVHGSRGELYASINSVTTNPNGLPIKDSTRFEVGGEYVVSDHLRVGFEASTTVEGALVPYEAIQGTNALNQYR